MPLDQYASTIGTDEVSFSNGASALGAGPSCNFICERSFGLQAEVLFFRAFGSMGDGRETKATTRPCQRWIVWSVNL